MARKLREFDEKNIDLQIKSLDSKKTDIKNKIDDAKKKSVYNAKLSQLAYSQVGNVKEPTPEQKAATQKMEKAKGDKFRADSNQENNEVSKLQDELKAVELEKANILKNKDNQINNIKENTMANLTKQDILRILESSQSAIMTKSELIETISKKILKEDMEDSVRRSFESGENDYSEILGRDLTNQLARESFEEVARNIREKTGKQNVTLADVQRILSNSLVSAAKQEYRIGIQNLEAKAVEMVKKSFKIPDGTIEFEATISGLPPEMLGLPENISEEEMRQVSEQYGFKVGKINRGNLRINTPEPQKPRGKSEDQLKSAVKRRRYTNAMTHGAARKSQNLHMQDDEFRRQNQRLAKDYSDLMAANDANYFLLDDATIKEQGSSGIHAGNVKVTTTNDGRYKIVAQGMTFPILLHELGKGVIDLMSDWGKSKDPEIRKYVAEKVDTLENETNDIRLGTKIWEKFVEQIPVDNQEAISLTWHKLQELNDDEYNKIVEGLIANKTQAQTKVRQLADEAIKELREEEMQSSFGDEDEPVDDDETPTADDDEEDDILRRIMGKQEPEDVEDDPETWSKKELDAAIDDALDAGDYDTVRRLTDILNRKY